MSVCGVVVQAPRNADGILNNNGLKKDGIMACIEEERKKAFVVFASTYEAAKYLTLEQKGELFEKLGAYSLEGKDVHSNNPMIEVILKMSFPNMDAAERRHQAAIKNGKKGKHDGGGIGKPRKGETKEEYQARLLEWKRSRGGGDNPQKPLNIDIDTNIDTDKDKKKDVDIERYTDTDIEKDKDKDKKTNIKKNTNNSVISNSVSTNHVSFSKSLNPVLGNTKFEEEPRQDNTSYQVSSFNSKTEESYSKCGEKPRQDVFP